MGRIQLANCAQAASRASREARIDRPGRHHAPAYPSRRSRNGLRRPHEGTPAPEAGDRPDSAPALHAEAVGRPKTDTSKAGAQTTSPGQIWRGNAAKGSRVPRRCVLLRDISPEGPAPLDDTSR